MIFQSVPIPMTLFTMVGMLSYPWLRSPFVCKLEQLHRMLLSPFWDTQPSCPPSCSAAFWNSVAHMQRTFPWCTDERLQSAVDRKPDTCCSATNTLAICTERSLSSKRLPHKKPQPSLNIIRGVYVLCMYSRRKAARFSWDVIGITISSGSEGISPRGLGPSASQRQ